VKKIAKFVNTFSEREILLHCGYACSSFLRNLQFFLKIFDYLFKSLFVSKFLIILSGSLFSQYSYLISLNVTILIFELFPITNT
jgi:hypothetical protein